MPYQHLNKHEREAIAKMHYAGMTMSEIGELLERNKGTISREISRNSVGRGKKRHYVGCDADELSIQRRQEAKKGHKRKIENRVLMSYIKKKLAMEWSPEQISGRLRKDHPGDLSRQISHVSIYGWLRSDKDSGGEYFKHLRQSNGRRRKKYGSTQQTFAVEGKTSIEERPKIVDKRSRPGDWEGDLVQGKNCKSYLVTLVERSSGYLLFQRVSTKQSHIVRRAIINQLSAIPKRLRKTLTFDNGTEFSDFKQIESSLGMSTYFAHPYASWERGTNENTNGLIRQYLPKGMDLRRKTTKELTEINQRLNNRPRKRLNYQTPQEVLNP